jgi:hypothetical protein
MMRGVNIVVCLLGLSLGIAANAASSDSGEGPYQTIVERNVFALKPPPSDIAEPPPPPPPLKITLTGITTMLGNKRAIMSAAIPNKPPENYMLTEGQRQGEIEVVEIDEKAGTVKVKNHGVDQTLDFETDGAKALPAMTAVPSPGIIPGQRRLMPPPQPNPGAAARGALPPPPSPAIRTIPTRSMRLPGAAPANPNGQTPAQ